MQQVLMTSQTSAQPVGLQWGRPCVCHAAFVRGQQYSILPALTWEGMIALDIFEGSVNKEHFIQFLNEQLVRNHSNEIQQ